MRRRSAYAGGFWLPLALAAMGAKLAKAVELSRPHPLRPMVVMALLVEDIVFYGVGWLSTAWLLGVRRRGARAIIRLLLHLGIPILFGMLLAEHVFFRTSGALADWYLLKEGVRGVPHLLHLYRDELSPARLALLLSPWGLSLGLFLSLGRGRAEDPDAAPSPRARRHLVGVAAGVVVLGMVIASTRALVAPADLASLRPSVLLQLFRDASWDLLAQIWPRRSEARSAAVRLVPGPTRIVAQRPAPTRNVVIIALESVGAMYTSIYGGAYRTTPFLEQFARQGAVVDRAYTVMPHTSKSLVSLMCGTYPKLVTSIDEANHEGIPARCLPKLLREQGYATAFFQTAEQNYERRAGLIAEMGFEYFVGKEGIDGRGFDESSYFGWEDDALLEPVDRWLQGLGGRPFLLSVLTLTSHHPYSVPRRFPVTSFTDQRELNDYLNTVAYSDRFVGKFLDRLRARGLMNNTLVVVLGDHGEGFGRHGLRQHDAVPYEEALRIPMILVGPGVDAGSRVVGLSQTIDVAPTVIGALGFSGDGPFLGKDLFNERAHERLFASCYLHEYCAVLIDGTTKVIHHFGRRPDQMFDIVADPAEQNDLLRSRNHPFVGIVSRSLQRLAETSSAIAGFYDESDTSRSSRFVSRARPSLPLRAASARLGDFVELDGYDISRASVEAGGQVVVTTLWHVLRKPEPGWDLFFHIDGSVSTNGDHVPAEGTYPVSKWEAGDYVLDRYAFATRPTFEPEQLRLRLGFWHRPTGTRASIVTKEPLQATADRALELGVVGVVPPPIDLTSYVTAVSPVLEAADIRFGRWVRLVSAEPDRQVVKAGLRLTTTYVFQSLAKIPDRFELHIEVEGPTRRSIVHTPVFGAAPLSTWAPGKFVRDPDVLLTKTGDAAGRYRILLSLHDKRTGRREPATGRGLPIDDGRVIVAEYQLIP